MTARTQILPGVFLTAVQTDQFKTGCFSINFLRPLRKEEASMNALLPNVLLRGSRRHPDMRNISDTLDELYGASIGALTRKKGETQIIGFYGNYMEDVFAGGEPISESVLRFAAELLLEPVLEDGAFRQAYLEGERENLLRAIDAQINDKRGYATLRMLQYMCQDELYAVARLGERAEAQGVTNAAFMAHYRTVLESSQAELFYMGKKPLEEVCESFRRALCELPRAARMTPIGTEVRLAPDGTVRELTETMDVTQGKLEIGLRTGCTARDAEYPALAVLNTVFGSGVTSKLFVNVREKRSLCYYASSALEKYKGLMVISSGIDFDAAATAREAILNELSDCQAGKITTEELKHARDSLISALRAAKDSPARRDDFTISQASAGLSGTLDEYLVGVEAVTREDVIAAARKIQTDTVYFLKGAAE